MCILDAGSKLGWCGEVAVSLPCNHRCYFKGKKVMKQPEEKPHSLEWSVEITLRKRMLLGSLEKIPENRKAIREV